MVAKYIHNALAAAKPAVGPAAETVALLCAAGLISYGAWEAYRPAGPIVGGMLLMAGVILRARGS